MKLPWSKFYARDWIGDPILRTCSALSRSVWIDMLCLMWMNHDRPGYLEIAGKQIGMDRLARITGLDQDVVAACIEELESADIFSREEDGTIYSRRILRDADLSESASVRGSKGGNPSISKQVKPQVKQEVKQEVNLQLKPEGEGEGEGDTEAHSDQNQRESGAAGAATRPRVVAFRPPTMEEVKLGAAKLALSDVEAEKFWHHYESKGWVVGKAKMKSWPSALAGWKTRMQLWQSPSKPTPGQPQLLPNGQPDLSKMCPSDRDAILLERRIDRGDFD